MKNFDILIMWHAYVPGTRWFGISFNHMHYTEAYAIEIGLFFVYIQFRYDAGN